MAREGFEGIEKLEVEEEEEEEQYQHHTTTTGDDRSI